MRVRAGVIGSLVLVLSVPLLAQDIPRASIVDKEMGWLKVYNFPPATTPLKVDDRVYSPAQRTMAVDLANWMQAGYNPIGGIGDVVRTFPKLPPGSPLAYGVVGKIYTELKYGANRAIVPLTNEHYTWDVMVNGPFGLQAEAINSADRYYFTIPTIAQLEFNAEYQKAVDLSGHPFLGQFPSRMSIHSNNGNRQSILLSKDRRLPFVKITRGEYLDAVDSAITRAYALDQKKLFEAEQGDKQRIARAMPSIEARHAKRREVLAASRSKYQGRLQEVAEISTLQPDIALERVADVFEGNGSSRLRLPVYTVDAATLERCRSDTPQWVVITWSAELNAPVGKRFYEFVVSQFNIEYIYNRLFYPEKIKGLRYTTLPAARAETATEASAVSKTAAADPSVFFFEDFSTTPPGKPPLNWRSTLSNAGASSVVVELPGLPGRWVSLNGFTVTPKQLNGLLPADFTVNYDLVAARDYTWGARGMTFRLSKGVAASGTDSIFSVRLRPGFGGRDGEAVIEGKFPGAPGYVIGTKWFAAPGFSNTQQNNRIAVSIRKQGEMVQVFIGQTKIAEYPKAIPPALLFDAISFDLSGQAGPNDQMFVSNIKITKH
jgi:hypothetical protein